MTTGLQKAQQRLAEMRARGEKPARLDPIEKARAAPASLRAAVTAKCWDCQCGDADPAPRWRIGNCRITDCPLWPMRPYRAHHGKPVPAGLER